MPLAHSIPTARVLLCWVGHAGLKNMPLVVVVVVVVVESGHPNVREAIFLSSSVFFCYIPLSSLFCLTLFVFSLSSLILLLFGSLHMPVLFYFFFHSPVRYIRENG